jgi:hypothetical protein
MTTPAQEARVTTRDSIFCGFECGKLTEIQYLLKSSLSTERLSHRESANSIFIGHEEAHGHRCAEIADLEANKQGL